MYILDTDHVSLLERGGPDAQRLRVRLVSLKAAERVTTIITFEEQMRGWLAYLSKTRSLSRQIETYRRLKGVLERYSMITVLDFNEAAAREVDRLKKLRLGIGTWTSRSPRLRLQTTQRC